MKKLKLLLFIACLLASHLLVSQTVIEQSTSINTNGDEADASAMLDVQATDKGMLTPRMTTAQRTAIAPPATGLLVYDTDTGSFWFHNGSDWINLSAQLVDADGDTKVQVEESADEDVVRFDAGGSERLKITSDSSEFTGLVRVGGSFISGASDNTASGNDSFVGGGTNNTASGNKSFVGGGFFNTALGNDSFVGGGTNNTVSGNKSFVGGGFSNTVSGAQSFVGGSEQSTASGFLSFVGGGYFNSASDNRAFVGGGSFNTASGHNSFIGGGSKLLAKSYSEAVFGTYNTDYTPMSTTSFNAADRLFVIGNGTSTSNRSNAVTVLKNGNTGIGTDTPDTRTEVNSDATTNLRVTSTSTAFADDASLQFLLNGDTGFEFRDWEIRSATGDLEYRVSEDNLGSTSLFVEFDYDASAGNRELNVGGHVRPLTDNTHDLGSGSLRWREVFAANGTINTSDVREKENIEDLAHGLAEILQLRPVSFTWKNRPGQGTKIGLVAQEVQPVIGEVVKDGDPGHVAEDGTVHGATDRMGIYYSDLIPVLIKGMQEQQALIGELQSELAALKKTLAGAGAGKE